MSIEAMKHKALELVATLAAEHVIDKEEERTLRQAIATEESSVTQEPVAFKRQLVKIHDALGAHIGDTDPYIPEDMKDDEVREYKPVFWAAKEIAALIGDAPWSDYTHPQPKAEQFWQHNCPEEGQIGIKKGQACDWCCAIEPKREWVGLTDEEKLFAASMYAVMDSNGFIKAIEAKLKERNQ